MLQLEKSFFSGSIHIVGDRRAAESDCLSQDRLDGDPQSFEFLCGEAASLASRANAGAKQTFIRINVADAMEKLLIQQRGFYGSSTPTKQRTKRVCRDLQWLLSGPDKTCLGGVSSLASLASFRRGRGRKLKHGQAPETARIDEANLARIVELQDGVSVLRGRLFSLTYKETTGHAKMNEPLSAP